MILFFIFLLAWGWFGPALTKTVLSKPLAVHTPYGWFYIFLCGPCMWIAACVHDFFE